MSRGDSGRSVLQDQNPPGRYIQPFQNPAVAFRMRFPPLDIVPRKHDVEIPVQSQDLVKKFHIRSRRRGVQPQPISGPPACFHKFPRPREPGQPLPGRRPEQGLLALAQRAGLFLRKPAFREEEFENLRVRHPEGSAKEFRGERFAVFGGQSAPTLFVQIAGVDEHAV